MQLKAIIEENLSGQRLDRAASSTWVEHAKKYALEMKDQLEKIKEQLLNVL